MTQNSRITLTDAELELVAGGIPCPSSSCRDGGTVNGNVALNPDPAGIGNPESIF